MPQTIDRQSHDDAFVSTAQALLPWDRLAALLAQHDPSGALTGMARGLRLHTVQQRYGLDDAALLRSVLQSPALREFTGLDEASAAQLGVAELQRFRDMLDAHPMANEVVAAIAPQPQAQEPAPKPAPAPKPRGPRAARKEYVWRFA